MQQLKGLAKLIILDLSGNALCDAAEYRSYTVFHLRRLKVLGGAGIESAALYLAYISPMSPPYLPYISPTSPLYLPYVSHISRLYLP